MNSDDLEILNYWKGILTEKKAARPLKPPYEGGKLYTDLSPEVKIIFDALADVVEVLTKNH